LLASEAEFLYDMADVSDSGFRQGSNCSEASRTGPDAQVNTIVESVETEEEWRWLDAHGVDYVQGYLFAAPATPPPAPRSPWREVE
jgi:EAL domain-containing protein (putative c-di-GMP-specific phosphodiesterase class I)